MRKVMAFLLVIASFCGSASASNELNVTHNVSVRPGFSVNSCAREIQAKTSADIVEILTSIGVVSIKSSDRDAVRVASLRCVEAVEKNETVSGYR